MTRKTAVFLTRAAEPASGVQYFNMGLFFIVSQMAVQPTHQNWLRAHHNVLSGYKPRNHIPLSIVGHQTPVLRLDLTRLYLTVASPTPKCEYKGLPRWDILSFPVNLNILKTN